MGVFITGMDSVRLRFSAQFGELHKPTYTLSNGYVCILHVCREGIRGVQVGYYDGYDGHVLMLV